jgi:hypothetical protein
MGAIIAETVAGTADGSVAIMVTTEVRKVLRTAGIVEDCRMVRFCRQT